MFRLNINNIRAQPQQPKIRRIIPNKVFLFTNARDEPSILEWAIHHILLGFTHVFIYDHKSIKPIQTLLSQYNTKFPKNKHLTNRITVIRLNNDPVVSKKSTNIKLPLMNLALKYSIHENADWLLYLDADEFLTLNPSVLNHANANINPVKQLLTKFHFADTLSVNWLMFGSSQHETQPENQCIINTFTHSDKVLDPHVKTFVRPKYVFNTFNPHYYPAIHASRSFAVTGNKMHPHSPFNSVKMPFFNAPAYIAHYVVQSKQEFLRRKGRAMDDGSGTKSGMYPLKNLHIVHNAQLNEQLKNRHGTKLHALFYSESESDTM